VEVVVIAVVRARIVGYSQDFVDVIAVNKQPLEDTGAVGPLGAIVMDESAPSIWLS